MLVPRLLLPAMLLWLVFCGPLMAQETDAPTKVLRVAGWDVYADPEARDKTIGYQHFEEEFGARVEFTPLTHLDKIIDAAESETPYDLFIISNEGVKLLYRMGLVQPLDLKQIPHYRELHHQLQYSAWTQFEGRVYAAPWAWGPTGLLYDAEAIPEPDSWNVLWDPKYRGRISLWNDVSLIWVTALSLGYTNVYNLTKSQLAAVREKLLALNAQVIGYYDGVRESYEHIENRGAILLNGWSDPSVRLRKKGRDFRMIIPKEGAVGMFDSYLISRRCTQPELAHQFIDHQISPEVQVMMTRTTGLPPANIETLALLTPQEIQSMHLDELDYFDRMILWDVMPRRQLYDQLLGEIRQRFDEVAR